MNNISVLRLCLQFVNLYSNTQLSYGNCLYDDIACDRIVIDVRKVATARSRLQVQVLGQLLFAAALWTWSYLALHPFGSVNEYRLQLGRFKAAWCAPCT